MFPERYNQTLWIVQNLVTKKNVRLFSGFTFSADSNEKKKKVDKMTKYELHCLGDLVTLLTFISVTMLKVE